MTEQPSMGEIVRRLDDISRRLDDTLREIRADRDKMAETYVGRREYDIAHREMSKDVTEVNARLDAGDAFRRQIIAGVSVNVIGLIIALVLSLSTLVNGGGSP